MLRYDTSILADQLGNAIRAVEEEIRLDQAVYGLDSRDELAIQELLATALRQHYEVAREVHYPSSAGARRTHRMRCDLVLTPKGAPLKLDTAPPSLFDAASNPCPPDQALWLEVKIACQYREGGRRHSGYGQQWRSAVVEDLRKMEQETHIKEAALVLVVFNESAEILEKDLDLFERVLVEKEVIAGFRQVRSIPILERIGHRLCTIAIWPTIQRP